MKIGYLHSFPSGDL